MNTRNIHFTYLQINSVDMHNLARVTCSSALATRAACDKGFRQGPESGNLEESLSQSDDFTAAVPLPKSYENYAVKIEFFMCLPPACFETGFGFVSGFEEG